MVEKRYQQILWVLLLVSATIYLLKTTGYLMIYHVPIDFRTFYYTAVAMQQGGNIYDYAFLGSLAYEMGDPNHVYPFLYPPPVAFVLKPMAHLSLLQASILWQVVSVIMTLSILFYSTRLAIHLHHLTANSQSTWLMVAAGMFFIVLPFDNNIKIGQINVFVLMIIIASLYQALWSKRAFLAGCLLAPAILIKMTPVLLLLFYHRLSGRLKIFSGTFTTMAIIILATICFKGGWTLWQNFSQTVIQASYGKTIPGLFPAAEVANFSFAGWLARLSKDQIFVRNLSWVLVVAAIGILLCNQMKSTGEMDKKWFLLPYLVLAVIVSPLVYLHHVIYLFPGLVFLVGYMVSSASPKAIWTFFLITCAVIVASIDWPSYYHHLGLNAKMLTSLNLYALITVLFITSSYHVSKIFIRNKIAA